MGGSWTHHSLEETVQTHSAAALGFSGATAIVGLVGILYFFKRFRQAKEKAAEDRRNFVGLFVPILMISAVGLWLLFFKNPFRSGSVRHTAHFAQHILGNSVGVGDLGGAGGLLGLGSVGKKFLYGFLCGMASIVVLGSRLDVTNNFVRAYLM